jgi:transcriptional regulator with XRE-family HTH domain
MLTANDIKTFRSLLGLSLTEFAGRCNVSVSLVSAWERNKWHITKEQERKIRRAFSLSIIDCLEIKKYRALANAQSARLRGRLA